MAELIFDELVKENFTSRGDGVFELNGAAAYSFTFASALRADGVTTAQADDLFPCTFTAAPNLVVSCIAAFTPGSPALLTPDTGEIYKTSALDGGLPAFGTKTGVVGLTLNAALLFVKNLSGGIANPDALRNVILPPSLKTFKASAALTALDAVLSQSGGDTTNFAENYLGGLVAAATGVSETADEQDIYATATGGIKAVRRSMKVWKTTRTRPIDAGNYLAIFNADQPGATYGLYVEDEADASVFAHLIVRGHASAAVPVAEIPHPNIEFDINGVSVRVRNTTGSQITVRTTPGRIA